MHEKRKDLQRVLKTQKHTNLTEPHREGAQLVGAAVGAQLGSQRTVLGTLFQDLGIRYIIPIIQFANMPNIKRYSKWPFFLMKLKIFNQIN